MITVAWMAPGRTRGPYPEGPKLQMTTAWKETVERRLVELGKDKAWLAGELGVHKATVGRMLGTQQTSSLVPQVVTLLGIALPLAEIQSMEESEDIQDMRALEPEDREQVRALIKRLARDRGQ